MAKLTEETKNAFFEANCSRSSNDLGAESTKMADVLIHVATAICCELAALRESIENHS